MTGQWATDDDAAAAWLTRAARDLAPGVANSAVTVSLVPKDDVDVDVKFAVELGLSIMLDKPLILAVRPGCRVPARLRRAADAVVIWDGIPADQRLHHAISQVLNTPTSARPVVQVTCQLLLGANIPDPTPRQEGGP